MAFNREMDFILEKKFDSFLSNWKMGRPQGKAEEDQRFEEFCCYYIFNQGVRVESDPGIFSTLGGGDDHGIDGYRLLVNGVLCRDVDEFRRIEDSAQRITIEVSLLQAKNHGSTGLEEQVKFLSGATDFLEVEDWMDDKTYKGVNPGLREAHNAYVEAVNSDKLAERIDVVLYWAISSKRTIDESDMNVRVGAIRRDMERRPYIQSLKAEYYGADRLVECVEAQSRENTCKITSTNVVRYPELGDGNVAGFTGFIPVTDFLEVIAPGGEWNPDLFEENVRDFMGEKTQANKGMADLLQDAERRWEFAFRNNGITIVAERLEGGVSDKWILHNYQIVNGCQTSNVIYNNREVLDSANDVLVPVRVIGTESEELLDAIVMSTNSQNEIKISDLSARSDLARQLVTECERHRNLHGLYFERRKGQYRRAGVKSSDIVNKEEVTRSFIAAVLNLPHRAIGYATDYMIGEGSIWHYVIPPELLYLSSVFSKFFDGAVREGVLAKKYNSSKYHFISYFVHSEHKSIQAMWSNYGDEMAHFAGDGEPKGYRRLAAECGKIIPKTSRETFDRVCLELAGEIDDLGQSETYVDRVAENPFPRAITKTVKYSTSLNSDVWADGD